MQYVLEKFGGERESQEGFREEEEGELDLRARVELRLGAEGRAVQAQVKVGNKGRYDPERNPEVERAGELASDD